MPWTQLPVDESTGSFLYHQTGKTMKYVIHLKPSDHWSTAGIEWAGYADANGKPTADSPNTAMQFDTESEAVLFGLAECTHAFVVCALTPGRGVVPGDVVIDPDGAMTNDMAEMVVSSVLDVMPPRVRDVATTAVRHLAAANGAADTVVPEVVDNDASGYPTPEIPAFHAIFGQGLWALNPYRY